MDNISEDLLLIDWFSFTIKNISLSDCFSFIGLDDVPWVDLSGARGYQDRKYFAGISIHYNGRPDMGTWFEFSGSGCRSFEDFSSLDWFSLLDRVLNRLDSHLTRLDIAFDDHSGVLPLDRIMSDLESGYFVSPSSWFETVRSSSGSSSYLGSPRSMIRLRFYDKAAERSVDGHWVRLEMQLRDDRALQMANFLYNDFDNFSSIFFSVLLNQVRFVIPSSDSNKSRWDLTDYWSDLTSGYSRLRLCTSLGHEYNLEDIFHNVFIRWGNAIDTVLHTMDLEEFNLRLQTSRRSPNPKYKAALDSYFASRSKV